MKPTLALLSAVLACTMPAVSFAQSSNAPPQSLNWEGQTGGVVTPFAYTLPSPDAGMGAPAISFLLLPGGDVVGTRFQLSIAAGVFNRLEIGYTKSAVASGSDETLGQLFDRGFQTIHAKAAILPERSNAPAIAAGFLVRYQRNQLEDSLGAATQDADVYVVVTKTITAIARLPVVVSGGVRATNASLFGLAGNAPGWTARGFAAAGVVLADRVLAGGEVSQQPAEVDEFTGIEVPATFACFVRLLPTAGRSVSVVAAVVRLAGNVNPLLDAQAEHRLVVGVAVHF